MELKIGVKFFLLAGLTAGCGIFDKNSSSDTSSVSPNSTDDAVETVKVTEEIKVTEKIQHGLALIAGEWRLKKIMCGDEESAVSPEAVLASDISNKLYIGLGASRREVDFHAMGCRIRTDLQNFSMLDGFTGNNGVLDSTDGLTACCEIGESCDPEPAEVDPCAPFRASELRHCDRPAGEVTQEYPITMNDDFSEMAMTMGEIAKTGGACAEGQDLENIIFHYVKQ